MENFLNIPVQREATMRDRVVLRGARGSGKTTVAIRWTVRQMIAGRNVSYICGVSTARYSIPDLVRREIQRHNREIVIDTAGLISIAGGGTLMVHYESSLLFRSPGGLESRCLVIDDADNLTKALFNRISRHIGRQFLITGTRDIAAMNFFLMPGWANEYVEINQHHMAEAGLMPRMKVWDWAKWHVNPETVQAEFGPWRQEGNRGFKHVLEKYDS